MNYNNLHIEPTTRCTLSCPGCPRTAFLSNIPIEDCDINTMIQAAKGKIILTLCGDHGDPIYHPNLHELLYRVRIENPNIKYIMHTNGAFRSTDWWKKTADLFNKSDLIYFSIDGLPKNNNTYRINSKWETIENGIKTLLEVNPNLKLVWKWIVFKYNQYDIDEGIELAKKLGFYKFELINSTGNTSEFNHTLDWQTLKEKYYD